MFYLTTHSTHFIYGYMALDIWLRTILIVRKETCCRHIGYSYRLTARVLLNAPSQRQDNTYHGPSYTRHGALAGTRNSSMGPPHEGSIRRPIAPWANALPLSYVPLPAPPIKPYSKSIDLTMSMIHCKYWTKITCSPYNMATCPRHSKIFTAFRSPATSLEDFKQSLSKSNKKKIKVYDKFVYTKLLVFYIKGF